MQIETILDWNRTQTVPHRLISVSVDGYKTPRSLLERGICVCNSCGTINPVERSTCSGCREERFILAEEK